MATPCTYCLQAIATDDRTIDHVIAESWYPPGQPKLKQWKVPACRRCNNRYSQIESRVRQQLALGVDTNDPMLKQIYEHSRRAWNESEARGLRDAYHRQKAKQFLLRNLVTLKDPNHHAVLPFSRKNFASGSRTGVRISADDLNSLGEKWTRGVFAGETSDLITEDYQISVYFLDDSNLIPEISSLMQYTKLISKDSEVQVWQGIVRENDTFGAMYRFYIWRTFPVYSIVARRGEELNIR